MNKKQYQQGIKKARMLERELSELISDLYGAAPVDSQQENALDEANEAMAQVYLSLKLAQEHEIKEE